MINAAVLSKEKIDFTSDNGIYGYATGYMLESWYSGRKAIPAVDSLITNPSQIVEGLERDELRCERDLKIDSVSGADITITTLTPLKVLKADYYNGAILVNVTMNQRYTITDDNGAGVLTLDTSPIGWNAAGNKDFCYIKNIQCLIDTDSFDVVGGGLLKSGTTTSTATGKLVDSGASFSSTVLVGMKVVNTTDSTYTYINTIDSDSTLTLENDIFTSGEDYEIQSTRYDWVFGRSLSTQQSIQEIFQQLMFESHAIRFKSYNKTRIVSLEDGNVVGTFSKPIRENGKTLINYEFTPLENIYTDFVLNYDYDYTRKKYMKQAKVNKGFSSDVYLDPLKTYCLNAEKDYKVNRTYTYSSDWIHDDTTAYYLLEKLVLWMTYQRMIVYYTGDIQQHIAYEVGDRVLINCDYMIPTSKNNAQSFLIVYKSIDPKKKVIVFNLLY
jgi:hypothetical protein